MFDELEGRLGHRFTRPELLQVALTHRSFHFENRKTSPGHFERMEFLGDAVLDLVLSEALMSRFPDESEGNLSKWRASLVNEGTLSEIARDELHLQNHLFLGKSEDVQREQARPRLLASALEAVIAAVYQDAGLEAARALMERLFAARLEQLNSENQYALDFKTRLQEWTQKKMRTVPEYRLKGSEGPEHAKTFTYEVRIQDEIWGEGGGNSRKSAEQLAAKNALEKVQRLEGEST